MTTSESSRSSSQSSRKNNKSDDSRSQTAFEEQNDDSSGSGGKKNSGTGLEDSSHGSTDHGDRLEPLADTGPHLTDDLVYLISSLIGRHVQVTVKNGARFEGHLYTTSPYKEHLEIVLRHPSVVKNNDRSDNNLPIADNLIIRGRDLATLCASGTSFCSTSVSTVDFASLDLADLADQPNHANPLEEKYDLSLDQEWHYYPCTSYGYMYPGGDHYWPFNRNSSTNTYSYNNNQEYMDNERHRVHYPTTTTTWGGKGVNKSRFNRKKWPKYNKNSTRSNPQWVKNNKGKCDKGDRADDGHIFNTSNRSDTIDAQQGPSKTTGRDNMGKKRKSKSTEQNMPVSSAQSPFKFNIDAAEFVPLGLGAISFVSEKSRCVQQNDSKVPPAILDTWPASPLAHALPPKKTEPFWPCGTMSYRQHSSLLYKTDQPALMSHYYSLPMYNYYQCIPYYDGGSDYSMTTHAARMVMHGPSLPPKPKRNAISSSLFSLTMSLVREFIKKTILENKVTIFSKSYCPYCLRAKDLFDDMNVNYKALELNDMPDGADIQQALAELTQQKTVPNIFVNQVHVGGADALTDALNSGKLATLLKEAGIKNKL
ncbi:hypothetical protein [Absidia glauca]|uniref:Uncharacterized protein n=1 Tax=Absidia glauca TaxID=4829 RepID=A0A168RQ82_ABSGL|nr:hypothetical protein [Absidia glauca]